MTASTGGGTGAGAEGEIFLVDDNPNNLTLLIGIDGDRSRGTDARTHG